MIELMLPYPPSGNHMWKHTRTGGHYLTGPARDYYRAVHAAVIQQARICNIDHPMAVVCTLYPPDKRRRDMDNAWKVIADSITRAGVWQDDHLVRRLTLEWASPVKGGKAFVSIGRYGEDSLQC